MPGPTPPPQALPLLRQILAGHPADAVLRQAFARTQYRSAPAVRRATSLAVFAYFRWWRWLEPRESLQKQLAAALALQSRFGKHPAVIKPEALAALAVPAWVRNEIPWPEAAGAAASAPASTVASDGPSTDTVAAKRAPGGKRPYPTELCWLQQLQRPPALWIRPKQAVAGKVSAALGDCLPVTFAAGPGSPTPAALTALRYAGGRDLFLTAEFQAGDFEIQDLASQLVGHACAPQPGETWWDACAGEGGKSLHLSDLMQNKGLLWVSDRSVRRLAKLKERAARAKVFNFRSAPWEGGAVLPTRTKFDGVLVDAPCS
ncbi:MAG: hypothetical protein ACHQ5A_04680, partial [Opitutales bacterium]